MYVQHYVYILLLLGFLKVVETYMLRIIGGGGYLIARVKRLNQSSFVLLVIIMNSQLLKKKKKKRSKKCFEKLIFKKFSVNECVEYFNI